MDKVMSKVKHVLAEAFPEAHVQLRRVRKGGPIVGTVEWDGFEDEEQIDRQVALREAINTHLPQGERHEVSFILTVTPHELAVMDSDGID